MSYERNQEAWDALRSERDALAERLARAEQQRDELAAQVEVMRHVANEWADVATSGMVWLENIHDGISSTQDAIDNTRQGIAHCREVVSVAADSTAAAILRQRDARTLQGAIDRMPFGSRVACDVLRSMIVDLGVKNG